MVSSVYAQDADKELKAKALFDEASNYAVSAAKSLTILDKIETDYPTYSNISGVKLRHAQCFMNAKKYDDAVSTAQALIMSRPNTIEAAWAQEVIGGCREKQQRYNDAVNEYLKVADIMPGRFDTTPYEQSMAAIARIAFEDYGIDTQFSIPNEYLAIDNVMADFEVNTTDKTSRGRLLAAAAYQRMQGNRIDMAIPIFDQLTKECPESIVERNWIASKMAAASIEVDGTLKEWANKTLAVLIQSPDAKGNEDVAKAFLTLARQSHKNGDIAQEIATLKDARGKCLPTDSGGEILYTLGRALSAQGQTAEALKIYQEIVDNASGSPYVPSALYAIGTLSSGETAISALKKLTEGSYTRRWNGIAYASLGKLTAPTDPAQASVYYNNAITAFQEYKKEYGISLNQVLIDAKIESINIELALLDKR